MIDFQEEIGLLRDKSDNLLVAATLPVSADIHVEGLTGGLREIREKLGELYDAYSNKRPETE